MLCSIRTFQSVDRIHGPSSVTIQIVLSNTILSLWTVINQRKMRGMGTGSHGISVLNKNSTKEATLK